MSANNGTEQDRTMLDQIIAVNATSLTLYTLALIYYSSWKRRLKRKRRRARRKFQRKFAPNSNVLPFDPKRPQ